MYGRPPSTSARGRGTGTRTATSSSAYGCGIASSSAQQTGPSLAQIQASYAALMDDDEYIPPTAYGGSSSSAARAPPAVSSGVSGGGTRMSSARGGGPSSSARTGSSTTANSRRPAHPPASSASTGGSSSNTAGGFHFQPQSAVNDDPHNYKLDSLVRRGSGGGPAPSSTTANRRGSSHSHSQGVPDTDALAQWSLPVDANRGGNVLGIGGGGGGGGQPTNTGLGGIHSGFFYNDNAEFNSDDDDVNNNALYYGDEQLRTGVTKKGTVAMSPGRIRRTGGGGSSQETSPSNVVSMRGRAGSTSSPAQPQPPSPTEAYRKSTVAAPSSASRGRGGGGGMSSVDVLNNEHKLTAKGRQVREDVDSMMDMYYANGGVNEHNALGVVGGGGGMVDGRGARCLRNDGSVVSGDESYTQQIDVRKSSIGSRHDSVTALANCTAAAQSDGPYSKPQTALVRMNPTWKRGPKNEEGRTFDASDRNLLCMDVRGDMAVVGSADHGLKVFDVKTMRERRNLYGKKCGHTEWVTSVVYLNDGRILSGGMDSKLCLWHSSALKCDDLLGHTGSISQVEVSPTSNIAVSSSYDRTLRVWNCSPTRPSCLTSLVGHGQPVMSFAWVGSMVMSGDRRGTVKVWDLETSACAAMYETKGGQIASLGHLLHPEIGQLSMVGDQKGVVSIFDFRRSGANPIFSEMLHPGGAVSGLKGLPMSGGGGLIVSAGADRKINILDPKMNCRPIFTMTDHKDFIYSMETFGDLIISGGGNGWLLVHDSTTGKCLYGLGANEAAVRCIFPSNEYLVAAGDDGKATVYDF